MQTFLPYPDFILSAQCLDWQRLGKQRVEAFQLASIDLSSGKRGWSNHPAYKMWNRNLGSLCLYGIIMCEEWIQRGYKDNTKDKLIKLLHQQASIEPPNWLGNIDFHRSHQSNLLRKGRERLEKTGKSDIIDRYRALWPDVPDNLPYIWPTNEQF